MERTASGGAPSPWVLRLLFLFFFCSFVLGDDNECFFPDGTALTAYKQCKDSTGKGRGLCCTTGSSCLENGLCFDDYRYFRGACHDPFWKDPNCPSFCRSGPGELSFGIPVARCVNKGSDDDDVWYCAGDARLKGDNCLSDTETFAVKKDYSVYDRIPEPPTPSPSDPSTAPATSTRAHSPDVTSSVADIPSFHAPSEAPTSTKTSSRSKYTLPPPKSIQIPSWLTRASAPNPTTATSPKPTTTTTDNEKSTETDVVAPSSRFSNVNAPNDPNPSDAVPTIPNFLPPSSQVPTVDVAVPTPTAQEGQAEEDDKRSIPIGVGAAFGSAILIAGSVLAFFYLRKRRRERLVRAETPPPESTYYEPEMGARRRDPFGMLRGRM